MRAFKKWRLDSSQAKNWLLSGVSVCRTRDGFCAATGRSKRNSVSAVAVAPRDASSTGDVLEDAGDRCDAERAARCCTTTPTSAALASPEVTGKRQRIDGCSTDSELPAASGRERHVEDHPMKGATSHCHGARATPCLSQLPHSLTAVAARFAVGGPTLPETVTEELRRRVQRLRSSTDGDFAPTGPPALLNELTDAVLVVASGIVSEAASTLSGKAQLRLLAWLLADARGATSPLDKKLAETVGKRLSAQAQRVRCALDEARSMAELQRAEARAAAALAADAADLPKRLAAIDAAEQQALSAPNTEVYVGFWELGAGSAEALAALPPCSQSGQRSLSLRGCLPSGRLHITSKRRRRRTHTCKSGAGRAVQCRL